MAIVTIDGIPVFSAVIEGDEEGMLRISLVDAPAVQSDFMKFAEQKPVQLFSIENEDKRLVYGVVMRADFPIYRIGPAGDEFYMIFRADTIRKMAQKYLAEGRQNEVNLMHVDGSEVNGVEMVQFFIKDTAKGVAPAGFDNIADGSLFAEFHVTNDEVWAQVKDGTFKGFSLEGIFDLEPETNEGWINEVVEEVGGLFEKYIPKLKKMNNKIAKIKAALAKALAVAFGQVTTDKGILEWDGEEDLKIGDEVYMTAEDGTRTAAEDGDYTIDDGKVIRVADGKVADIIDPEAEVAPETEEVETEAAEEEVENPDTPGEESAPDAIEALRKEVNELFARVDAFETRINELTEEVAKLKEAPAAEPAHDEFKRAFKPETTDKKVANAVSIAGARR
jgi:hypothetical protein